MSALSTGRLYPQKMLRKAVPLQAWSSPEGSRKLRLPDFMTTPQDGGRVSALRTGRLYRRKCSVKQSRYRLGVAQRVPGS